MTLRVRVRVQEPMGHDKLNHMYTKWMGWGGTFISDHSFIIRRPLYLHGSYPFFHSLSNAQRGFFLSFFETENNAEMYRKSIHTMERIK